MSQEPRRQLEGPLLRHLHSPENGEARLRIARHLFSGEAKHRPRLAWALATSALVIGVALLTLRSAGEDTPLTTQGRDFTGLRTAGSSEHVRFDDGSSVHLATNTSVVALGSSARDFSLLLEVGQIEVSVAPKGPRRWRIETKLADVEVVGTVFSVERSTQAFATTVTEGVVGVRSRYLPEGAVRLTTGQGVKITVPPPEYGKPSVRFLGTHPEASRPPAGELASQEEGDEPAPNQAPSDGWDVQEAGVDEGDVRPKARGPAHVDDSRPPPRPQLVPDIEQRWRDADSARRAGNWDLARRLYETLHRQLSQTRPDDPRLPTVLFAWATTTQARGDARAAGRLLQSLLDSGAPRSLREDAWLRLVESHLALGDGPSAEACAEKYRAEFPQGRHRLALSRLLGNAPP